jgi:hypothetical protein
MLPSPREKGVLSLGRRLLLPYDLHRVRGEIHYCSVRTCWAVTRFEFLASTLKTLFYIMFAQCNLNIDIEICNRLKIALMFTVVSSSLFQNGMLT